MRLQNLLNIAALVTPEGWERALQIIDQTLLEFGLRAEELATPEQIAYYHRLHGHREAAHTRPRLEAASRSNPFDPKAFKDHGLHPESDPTYKEVLQLTAEIKKPGARFSIYQSCNTSAEAVAQCEVAIDVAYKLLKLAGLWQCLNGISIGILPNLQSVKSPGNTADAFGLYYSIGNYESILLAQSIKPNVIDEFESVTRAAIWQRATVAELFHASVKDEVRKAILCVATTVIHELGHRVQRLSFQGDYSRIHQFFLEYRELLPLSPYAKTRPEEWFAESFAAWVFDRLSYNKPYSIAFEQLLTGKNASASIPPVEADRILTALQESGIKVEDKFKLRVEFQVGPPQEVIGTFLGYTQKPFPAIQYRSKGLTTSFVWVPGRAFKSVHFKKAAKKKSI